MCHVEVARRHVLEQAFLLQRDQVLRRLYEAAILVVPPVELYHIGYRAERRTRLGVDAPRLLQGGVACHVLGEEAGRCLLARAVTAAAPELTW